MASDDTYYAPFPAPKAANEFGFLCQGGSLKPELLLFAYSRGIFPWYEEGDPIYWWTPDPRWVLFPDKFHLPKRSARHLKKNPFELTRNLAFERVISYCADLREDTWITEDMKNAYILLHRLGFAHSFEAWRDGRLCGGLYGVALGRVFFGESMFYLDSEASRASLWGLVKCLKKNNFALIDCQQETEHTKRMGAEPLRRENFLRILKENVFQGDMQKIIRRNGALQGAAKFRPEADKWAPWPHPSAG